MKRKIMLLILLVCATLSITSCNKKEEEEKMEEKVVAEINEGTVDGYKFKVTDEVTDRVKIQMENGDIMLVVLSNSDTPITIENFKKLVSKKFYDGLIFHRVIENFMIQGGDPTGTGYGSDTVPTIKGEFDKNGVKNKLSHTRGVISMARRGGNPETADTMNSASSQFFICHADATYLDGSYASFGKVFAGLDVLDKIASVETNSNDKPLKEQKIKSIRFIEIVEE